MPEEDLMINSKSPEETQNLLDILSKLPKSNENNTASIDDKPKKKWSRVQSGVVSKGRVNKTKGK
jgi:hypothetical protein